MRHLRAFQNRVMPILDIHELNLDDEYILSGFEEARNHFVRGDYQTFGTLYAELLISDIFEETDQFQDVIAIEVIERHIKTSTPLNLWPLEGRVLGFHLAWVLIDIHETWNNFIATDNSEAFIKKLISQVSSDIDHYLQTYDFLLGQIDNPKKCTTTGERIIPYYGCLVRMLRGSLFGRLQRVAYLVELIISWISSEEQARQKFASGMVAWQVGWLNVPRNLAGVILDILQSRLD